MSQVPLYRAIKERLREEVIAPRAGTGRVLPTERELQVLLGASRPTIAKALAELAAEGHIVREHGRRTYAVPPGLVRPSGAAPIIGFVAPLSGEELVQRAFRGIDRYARRHGYRVLMGNAGNNVAREAEAVRDLVASGARGLVVNPCIRRAEELASDYLVARALSVPTVLIDTALPQHPQAQVLFDNRRACRVLTNWLIEHGRTRIALLFYDSDLQHPSLAARRRGHQDALAEHGVSVDPDLQGGFSPSGQPTPGIAANVDRWLRLADPPTAIIAADDTVALEVIEHLRRREVRVPDDVTVLGFDNRSVARNGQAPSATTNPDFERMGEVACELVLEGASGGSLRERTHVLDLPVILRRGAYEHARAPARQPNAADPVAPWSA